MRAHLSIRTKDNNFLTILPEVRQIEPEVRQIDARKLVVRLELVHLLLYASTRLDRVYRVLFEFLDGRLAVRMQNLK